jgi:hypothetical protein
VTVVPAQILADVAEMTIVGVTCEVTIMEILFEITRELETHNALLVSSQLTTSPLESVLVLKELLLDPTLIPFSFHW